MKSDIVSKKVRRLDLLYRFIDGLTNGTFVAIALLSAATTLGKSSITLYAIIAFILNIILLILNGILANKFEIESNTLYKYKNEDFIEAGIMVIIFIILLALGWI